jgi:hypothetical protein
MFYYHTDPRRQLACERVEQLARDMRRIPDPMTSHTGRADRSRRIADVLRRVRRAQRARVRAQAFDG